MKKQVGETEPSPRSCALWSAKDLHPGSFQATDTIQLRFKCWGTFALTTPQGWGLGGDQKEGRAGCAWMSRRWCRQAMWWPEKSDLSWEVRCSEAWELTLRLPEDSSFKTRPLPPSYASFKLKQKINKQSTSSDQLLTAILCCRWSQLFLFLFFFNVYLYFLGRVGLSCSVQTQQLRGLP